MWMEQAKVSGCGKCGVVDAQPPRGPFWMAF